jgi:predicted proteasome-type protease
MLSDMTLALAMRCRDGVVIAADSRAVSGTSYQDGVDKITRVARNCCIAVSGNNATAGIPYIRDLIREMPLSIAWDADVHNVARMFQRLLDAAMAATGGPDRSPVSAARFLIAGYMGGADPTVYSLVLEPLRQCFSLLDQPEGYNKLGEEGLVTYYVKAAGVRPASLSCREIAPLVHFILHETVTLRCTVGEPLRMFFVRETGVEEVDPDSFLEVSSIASKLMREAVSGLLAPSKREAD